MAKRLLHKYTFSAGTDTVVIDGNWSREKLLLITNVTDNIIIYNFADPNLRATSHTYNTSTDQTTVVLNYDCTAMSDTDILQIFVEEEAVAFKPSQTFIDPVSKFRVSQGETLIDTDFEYGLQATKWETLELVNNIPGFYSKTGDTPLSVTSITGTAGDRTLTVTAPSHGQSVGTPIDIRGVSQPNLEGSYIITKVPDADTFTFVARTEVATTGTLNTPYTSITPGRFYASSQLNYSEIVGIGTSITVTTPYPSGFKDGSEFYLVNTLGTQVINFNAANADAPEIQEFSQTFDPNSYYSSGNGETNTTVVDIWDYTGVLNSKFFRAGALAGTNVGTNNFITLASHGFNNGDAVAVVQGPQSVLPTGLTDQQRYYVRLATTDGFRLATTNADASVVAITGNTGKGVFAVMRGFGITAVNATNNVVTLDTTIPTTVTTTTPLLLVNSTTTAAFTATPETGNRSPVDDLWDGGTIVDYFTNTTNTSSPTLKLTSTTTTVWDITGNTITGSPILIPVQLNSNANTINIANHKFVANDPVTGTAITYRYSVGSGRTAIGGLTNSGVYYAVDVTANRFAFSNTIGGSRINLTGFSDNGDTGFGTGGVGYSHTIFSLQQRPTQNTLLIPGHGLSPGAQVTYGGVGSGTTIGGLTENQTYYVGIARSDTSNRITLTAVSGGSTVNITSAGVGTHTLSLDSTGALDGSYSLLNIVDNTKFTLNNISSITATTRAFDPQTVGIVSTGDDTIRVPNHRFINGTQVTYSVTYPDSTAIGGLADGQTYYAVRQTKDKIKLSSSYENAIATPSVTIDLNSTGVGKTHSFTTNSIVGESVGVGSIHLTNGSAKVEGTDTFFLSQFKGGDSLIVDLPDAQSGLGTVFVGEVASVGSNTQLTLVSAANTAGIGLTYLRQTALYIKSDGFALHRPFDGGVEMSARGVADAQIIRQTRRYFRYQSGKGLNIQFAINFNPPIDAQSIVATGTTATVTTRYRHNIGVGATITVRGAETGNPETTNNPFNGNFTITSVPTETTFTYTMSSTPSQGSANGFPEFVVNGWGGARLRAGAFDDQNGMFWEYDGTDVYAVRRDSVQQIAGTVNVIRKSNLLTGTNTRFFDQFAEGDRIVIRGQTYKLVKIDSNTTAYIQPAYRGETTTGAIASKTINLRTKQSDWSIDPCDGSGPNGYVLDKTRIQMAYIDYSWYGAGKIRYGFKDADGEVFYCHEYKHNNNKTEAYLRSGNMPARYEIENIGKPLYSPSLAHWGTTVQMDGGLEDDQAYLFTASSSLLSFSGASVGVAVTAGVNGGQYIYVNESGTTSTGISTYTVKTFNGSSTSASNGVDTSNETINFSSNHGYSTGQLVQYNPGTGGTIVGGLTANAYYYVRVFTSARIQLYTSEATAIAGGTTGRVNLTSTGTGTAHEIRSAFRFSVTSTFITGYGNRILHRVQTTQGTWTSLSGISFGTPITSTAIASRGGDTSPQALVYRVLQSSSPTTNATVIDFFFANEPKSLVYPSFPSLGETGFIAGGTSAVDTFTLGDNTPVPPLIPLISVRLSPSVDSGLTGDLGVKEILNRMQLDLKGVGLLTTHDVDIRLILNGQLDNFAWQSQGIPSLSQLVSHTNGDALSSGINIFSFRASGGSEITSGGKRNANTFTQDISSLLSLGNAILGGNGTYPDGPDILTLAVAPLNPSQITLASPLSVSGRITWSESQA